MTFHIARRVALSEALTESQFRVLLRNGVLRSDEEIAAETKRQADEG